MRAMAWIERAAWPLGSRALPAARLAAEAASDAGRAHNSGYARHKGSEHGGLLEHFQKKVKCSRAAERAAKTPQRRASAKRLGRPPEPNLPPPLRHTDDRLERIIGARLHPPHIKLAEAHRQKSRRGRCGFSAGDRTS